MSGSSLERTSVTGTVDADSHVCNVRILLKTPACSGAEALIDWFWAAGAGPMMGFCARGHHTAF